MKHLSKNQIKHLSNALIHKKSELIKHFEQNDHYGMNTSQRDYTNELSMYDNHPADLATEVYEAGKDIALNEHDEIRLAEVERALEQIEEGTYAICQTCGKPISFERMEATLTAQYCIDHTPSKTPSFNRSIEEEFLHPPFGRTSLDDQDAAAFDGEDAWQIVQSWGTSDSPAMAEQPEISDYNDLYIESDEPDGYVDPIESFLATDLYGKTTSVVRNREYKKMMQLLSEPDIDEYMDQTDFS